MRALLTGIALCWLLAAPALARKLIPPLGSGIDDLLPQAKLADADLKKVKDLRERMGALATAGHEKDARKTEEDAMRLLGFEKAWLKCGEGTFAWVKAGAGEAAGSPAPAPQH